MYVCWKYPNSGQRRCGLWRLLQWIGDPEEPQKRSRWMHKPVGLADIYLGNERGRDLCGCSEQALNLTTHPSKQRPADRGRKSKQTSHPEGKGIPSVNGEHTSPAALGVAERGWWSLEFERSRRRQMKWYTYTSLLQKRKWAHFQNCIWMGQERLLKINW